MVGMGTLFNTATVLAGSAIGLAVGKRLPERFRQTAVYSLGLITFFLAFRMMTGIAAGYGLHVVAAVLFGAILGEALKLEQGLECFGEVLKRRFARGGERRSGTFVEGFVVASLIFCVGPMTLLGTFEDGIGKAPMLLYVKGTMDGVMALALAASLGMGVVFSALFVLVFQGALTAAAALGAPHIPDLYVQGIEATGGVLVLAIGLLLLDVRRIRVANLLPALALVCLFLWLWPKPIG